MQRCCSNSAVKKGINSMICAQLIIHSPIIVIKKNLDGHRHFIGCSLWKRSDPVNSHRFMSLPTDINERLVVELFQNKGRFNGQPLDGVKKCARVVPIRNGAKGRQECRM